MANIYEIYGREVERHQKTLDNYNTTLALLRDLHTGSKRIEDVVVTPDGWQWVPSSENKPGPEEANLVATGSSVNGETTKRFST